MSATGSFSEPPTGASGLDGTLAARLAVGPSHRVLRKVTEYGPRSIVLEGDRRLINFSSNDYLGLSVENGSGDLITQPSSRLLSGNAAAISEAEDLLADWFGKEAAVIFSTGYMANSGLLSALLARGDEVYLDRLCHASLYDGARLGEASIQRFRHLDLNHLEELLQKSSGRGERWVVCESIYSMDGDSPNLRALLDLKHRWSFRLILDEAHAMGICGPGGRGFAAREGCLEGVDILVMTLSKSFALAGGVVVGSAALKHFPPACTIPAQARPRPPPRAADPLPTARKRDSPPRPAPGRGGKGPDLRRR
ncbi:MAG: pyridoxal phosphate-dependent aminotransferase family protein [Planctomycetes bacterium]|nr:pyridoxal phosphate-dependent aminotransferase family protein [Planctomycetota bacterium]